MKQPAADGSSGTSTTFGDLLKYLRRRARLTQDELSIAVGYSREQISRLEQNQRLPDLASVEALFVPALDLEGEPLLAAQLIELAAAARGERPAQSSESDHTAQATSRDLTYLLETIPPAPRYLIPRHSLLARAQTLVLVQRHLALCGMPGIGKTTLMAALARERPEKAPVFWYTFTEAVTTGEDTLVHRLAIFLQAHGQSMVMPLLTPANSGARPLSLDQQVALLGAGLSALVSRHGRAPLLCFDNAQLIRKSDTILYVLRQLGTVTPATLMFTSREDVPLADVSYITVDGLEPAEWSDLLDRVGTALDDQHAEQLWQKTRGNPMLLRLAVGQLHQTGVETAVFIDNLAKQPQVASYLLDTVVQHLSTPAHNLAALLSVFRQPVDLYDELLLELSQTIEQPYDLGAALVELQRYHLIDSAANAELHPLARDHIYARLGMELARRRKLHAAAAEWEEQARDDMPEAAYHYGCADMLAQAVDVLSDQSAVLSRLGQAFSAVEVIDGLLVRVRRQRDTKRELTCRLLLVRGELLANTLRAQEAGANFEQALALAITPHSQALCAVRLARSWLQRGRAAEALELSRQSSGSLDPDDALLLAQLAAVESEALLALTRHPDAAEAAQRALTLSAGCGAEGRLCARVRAQAQYVLGILAHMQRDISAARTHWRKAAEAARQAEFAQLEYRCQSNIGIIHHDEGDLDAAVSCYTAALDGLRAIGDSYLTARTLHNLANTLHVRGDLAGARSALEQACDLKRQLGDPHSLATSEIMRARMMLAQGESQTADVLLTQLLTQLTESGDSRIYAFGLLALSEVLMVTGNPLSAQDVLKGALALPGVLDDSKTYADLQNHLALAQLAQGQIDSAMAIIATPLPRDVGWEITIDRAVIRSLATLMRGRYDIVSEQCTALKAQIDASGYYLYRLPIERLATATIAPEPTDLPRWLWLQSC
jgi:ATP/maltotriose-dependent transcriptional regulator MalT/DNA-binding XRE family transcriptional regulator